MYGYTYTTQGAMTQADLEDLRELYDLDLEAQEAQAEEEAMEKAHEAHADQCRACQEEAAQRETGARVALQMDTARRVLEKALRDATIWLPPVARQDAERALEEAREAIRAI